MGFSELCIRRPVFATVLSLIIVLIGAVSYQRLTVREYPNIDEPVVSVATTYPGASATIMESQVTQVLEGSIAGIAGIDVLESSSRSESSRITVRFRLGVDADVAASDVRDRVSRVRRRLPDEIDEPVIAKVEADAQPIIFISFMATTMNALELTDYIDRYVTNRLKNLTGVADVSIFGERRYAMRIWVDRERLAAYNLTVQDIEAALRAQNVELPSGRIESRDREFTVLSRTGLTNAEQFENIVVKLSGNYQVKMKDIARVELGAADQRRDGRYNGQTSVTVGIVKQAVANPLDVSEALRAVMPDISASLPDGVTAEIANDNAVFIDRSIQSVFHTILEAIVLVVLVILFFLRSLRASLIPIVTIPISLIATFTLMYALGFSVNTLTLLAMVLAIGLVVDDAIVVLENIHRHVEHGMKPKAAAIKGIKEIGFAVVAMTLTLVAVYAPVAFSPGRTGRLFLEFALTLAGAVLVSGFVALTLTPMMCSKILKHEPNPGFIFRVLERGFNAFEHGYRRLLVGSLKVRALIILLAIGVAGMSGYYFTHLRAELAPVEDRGVIMIRGSGPEGATLAYMSRYSRQIEDSLREIPEMQSVLVILGFPEITDFMIVGRLKDWDVRQRSQQEIAASMRGKLARIPGVMAYANNPASLGQRGSSRPIEFILQTSGTYEELQGYVDTFLKRVGDYPGFVNLDSDLKLNKPEFRIELDRAKVADLGLEVSVIGRTLETLLGGRQVTRFEVEGEQYDVYVQMAAEDRASPSTLSTIFLRAPNGQMVQLSNIVKVTESVAPKELRRFNQLRSATISANLAPGYALGDGLAYLDKAAQEVLPATVQTDYGGQSREFHASSQSLAVVFVLALGFIYLVLAAQFESFRDPVIILLTVPLSMTGALAALYYAGGTLNVYSQIGLVTLVGLITKHGILIVEFANQQQEAGKDRLTAVVEAATMRLRPILMTTGAMVLGAMPLAFAEGAGAESRQQIGLVIVGGLTLGTLLTLFVVPTVYSLVGRIHKPHEEHDEAHAHGHHPEGKGNHAPGHLTPAE
ncbi:efflux RND transporter permease subunit [Chelatococcus asaccharovorans]|uniref:Multidrug efflux pump n=1 Tax=Chelatococcus asaccharovorans TaxID=28210 RepID=A0A2V3U987_9HYPH|nr:efflux RND transporter permease subunit [Chelatococcus asaccharovorans]MBS7705567.1 efflux RND transporter permease subunit [Chelatococcus asaccharovorans]PXW60023.1 multidrug efflux pump [Chelatococcus asaccharovorans]